MLRVAVDMDDVLAQTHAAERAWLTARGGTGPEPGSDDLQALEAMMQEGSFFGTLAVMPESQRVLAAMAARYEVFVATAAMEFPRSFSAKFAWLERHFPFIPAGNIVFCGDKSVVRADFLIDDSARHFRRFGGQGVLFTAAHNTAETGYPRVDDWCQVEHLFLSNGSPIRLHLASKMDSSRR